MVALLLFVMGVAAMEGDGDGLHLCIAADDAVGGLVVDVALMLVLAVPGRLPEPIIACLP